LFRLEVLQHLLDSVLDFLLAWDTWRVDIIDTGADVAGVGLVDEDLKKLRIRLAVLNRENIRIESSDSVEEVLELRVAEVGVNLGRVLDTRDGETERLDSPVEICLTFLAGTKRETFTKSWLINLNDVNASGLEIHDFVTESKSKLLSLNGLVNIIARE
jgi:hypothetical protein